MKINKFGKTRKDTRWKRGEHVVTDKEKQSESEDGGMRELREVRLVKTSGEREERWLELRPEGGRKWNE